MWKYEEIHEEGIRLAAAVAESFLSRGIEVGLITNGRDCQEKSEIFLPGQSGRGQREKFLQCLARIDLGERSRRGAGSSLIVWQRKKSFFWQKRVFVY